MAPVVQSRPGLSSDVWRDYYDTLAKLIPNSCLQEATEKDEDDPYFFIVAGPEGNDPPISALLTNQQQWLEAIRGVIKRIQAASGIET